MSPNNHDKNIPKTRNTYNRGFKTKKNTNKTVFLKMNQLFRNPVFFVFLNCIFCVKTITFLRRLNSVFYLFLFSRVR